MIQVFRVVIRFFFFFYDDGAPHSIPGENEPSLRERTQATPRRSRSFRVTGGPDLCRDEVDVFFFPHKKSRYGPPRFSLTLDRREGEGGGSLVSIYDPAADFMALKITEICAKI